MKEFTITIDAAGPQGCGKTRAMMKMIVALATHYEVLRTESLNNNEHQIRLTLKRKGEEV